MRRVKLHVTTDLLDRCWHLVNERRNSTTHLKVTVDDLKALLLDHATLSTNTKETADV